MSLVRRLPNVRGPCNGGCPSAANSLQRCQNHKLPKGCPLRSTTRRRSMPGPKQRHSSPSGAEKAAKDQRRRATAPAAPTTIDTDSTPSTPRPAEPADAGESAWANGRLVELLHEGDGAAAINHVNAHVATCPSLARTAMDAKTTRSALHVAFVLPQVLRYDRDNQLPSCRGWRHHCCGSLRAGSRRHLALPTSRNEFSDDNVRVNVTSKYNT